MRPGIITSKTYSLCAVCILLLSYGAALYLLFSQTKPVNAAPQATFVVNSLADTPDVVGNGICADIAGNCTLRAAIQEANHNGIITDTITFDLSGIIYLNSALPELTAPGTIIDGFGQSITITKAAAAGHFNALTIASNDNTIQNLTITGMTTDNLSSPDRGNGIRFMGAPRENWLDYLTISNNARDGIAMEGSSFRGNIIVRSAIRDNGRNGITVIGDGQAFGKLNSIIAVTTIANNGNTGISVTGAGLWVTGNTLDNNPTALYQANNSDFFIVYANNIVNYDTATLPYTGSGKRLIGHNWWDSYSTMPAGLTTTEWSHRLGAPILAWVDAFTTASLLDGHGLGPGYENPPLSDAVLTSSRTSQPYDIAVIISHGRDPNNIPFGHAISDIDNLCSDYYDFFVIDSNASSSWTLSLPIDNNDDCNEQTLDPKRLFTITNVGVCAGPPALNCWSQVPTAAVTISGQQLIISNLTTAALGGTPFVAGPNFDPSSITLAAISARMTTNYSIDVIAVLLLLVLVSTTVMVRRSPLNHSQRT